MRDPWDSRWDDEPTPRESLLFWSLVIFSLCLFWFGIYLLVMWVTT